MVHEVERAFRVIHGVFPGGLQGGDVSKVEEALEIVKQNGQPDLLLTDIMLPGMNGLQLAATMRNENPGLKVVYVSGYAGDEAAYGELPMGSRFLPKPFTLGALTSAVRETLFPE